MADVLHMSEADLLANSKPWLESQCDELKIPRKSKDTKQMLANAIIAHRNKPLLPVRSTPPAQAGSSNVFQNDRQRAISPPASIHMPPPQNAKGGRSNGVTQTPRAAPPARAAPATVAVTAATKRGRSPARVGARERSSSVSRGSVAPPILVAPPLAPAPVQRSSARDDADDAHNAQFADVPHDRSPSPAPRRAAASPTSVVAASRSKSPVRFTRNDVSGGDYVATAERAAHRRMILMVAGGALAVLVLVAAVLLRAPTPPGQVAAFEALQRLREAHGAYLCNPLEPYKFSADQLFGTLIAAVDREQAKTTLLEQEGVKTNIAEDYWVEAAFATPTLGCRFSLFASDNWPLLLGVGAILAAALALVLRAQQAKWRQRRTHELVKEVFATLKAQAAAYEREETKQSFIAAVHLRDSLLPHESDATLWDDVLAIVQRNTCVKTSGRLVGGAQCDVLEWVAPLAVDHPREEFRSPPRVASPPSAHQQQQQHHQPPASYSPYTTHRVSYPIL
jgi:hypothetical protein